MTGDIISDTMGTMTTYADDMMRTLDKLDVEEDDRERAILIDHAIALSDLDAEAAEMWKAYR